MNIRLELEREGNWLFRWRSYVPFAVMSVLFAAMAHFTYPYNSHAIDTAYDFLCLGIAMIGLAIRVATVGFVPDRTSGRNTQQQVADTLNTSGMYSVMRHPLYFGNLLIWLGVAAFPRIWWCPVIVAMAFALVYERIMCAEEQFLCEKFGSAFERWAIATPAFWPKFSNWHRPDLNFSVRSVLRRENSTLFGIVAMFFLLEEIGTIVVEHRMAPDVAWAALFGLSALLYMVLKLLKKSGRLRSMRGGS